MIHLHGPDGRRRTARSGAVLLAALLLGGCYSHVRIPEEQLRPQSQVRAHLSDDGAEEIGRQLGQEAAALEGVVLSVGGDQVLLAVPSGTRRVGLGSEPLFQRVGVPRSAVLRWERRQLDRPRTIAAASALGMVAGWVAYQTFTGEAGGSTITRPGDGRTEIRIPLLRLPTP
jgi:hypothetical protein